MNRQAFKQELFIKQARICQQNTTSIKTPYRKGVTAKPRLHARIVPRGVITTEMLSEEIHDASSLTTGDVEATITMLSKAIIRNLKQGKRIHIKGLGYLEMTLQCPPIKDPKEIRAESISSSRWRFVRK